MRLSFILLVICSSFTLTALAQQHRTIALEEAIEIALENNYRLQMAENDLELADAQEFSAKADFLPSASARFSGGRSTGQVFSNIELRYVEETAHDLEGSISAEMTIFEGFRNVLNLRQSRVGAENQRANVENIRQTVIFDVVSQYLQVLVDRELLEISRTSLESVRLQLEKVEAQVDVGAVPSVDLYNQQSTLANSELEVIEQENTLAQSKASLVRTLQLDPMQEYDFPAPDLSAETISHSRYNVRSLMQQALENRSDLKMQELTIESNRYDVQMARGGLYPTVTASANISSDYGDTYRSRIADPENSEQRRRVVVGFGDQFLDQRISRSMGFSASIPIFSNWNTREAIRQSETTYDNAILEMENQQLGVMEEVRQAYTDLVSFQQQLEASQAALQAAEQNYESQQHRYDVGSGSLLELNDATDRYNEAQSEFATARYRLIFQDKLIQYYIGIMEADITLD